MHCQKKDDLCKMQQNLNVSYPFERNSLLDIVRNISHFFKDCWYKAHHPQQSLNNGGFIAAMKILYLVTFRIWISHVLCLNSKYKAQARPSTHQIYRDSMTQSWFRWPTNPISILVLWHLILKACLRSLFGLVSTWLWFSFDLSSGIAADFIGFDSIEGITIEFHYFSEIAWNGWTIYFIA